MTTLTESVERADKLQHIFQIGFGGNRPVNRSFIVLPLDTEVDVTDVSKCLPVIVEIVKERYGDYAITKFSHVEYLGRG